MSRPARDPRAARPEAILIGGSAGAFEAVSLLVAALPAGYPTPVVVLLHQPRRTGSCLPGVLQARCALPVREAEDKQPLAGGGVSVAPSDYHLLVDAGPSLALSVDEPVNYSRPSIDVLFASAADVLGARCAAVVLSGANADGACGAKSIHDAGGLVLVQDPEEAPQPAMPRAALAICPGARALPAAAIAEWMRGAP